MFRFILLFFPLFLLGHQASLSYLTLQEDSNKNIQVLYKSPLQDIKANKIYIKYPQNCKILTKQAEKIENGFIINSYQMKCGKKGLFGTHIWIKGLIKQNKGVLIKYANPNITQSALLRADKPFIHINTQNSGFKLFQEYVILGIHHILSGYDHLLFVLSLLLLATNLKSLLYAVTAFTLSHSITLACSILGLMNLPSAFAEAMIALSIVFLARELIMQNQNTLTKKHLEYIAFIFGLLHGFGFSNVLKSIGLPQDEIQFSLFAFNIGIEIGQLVFILIVLTILFVINKFVKDFINKSKPYFGYIIGVISSFWLIQRILSF
jgi:hydrogenase/urease accessory protein HupE